MLLLELAQAINLGEAAWHKGQGASESVVYPKLTIKQATPGTWWARDNIAQVLTGHHQSQVLLVL
jgi:outer membrane protein assembly factor BamE (lipoprotein component of BamABCDE complex)